MSTACERLDIKDLEAGQADEKAQFLFRVWRNSLDSNMSELQALVPVSQDLLVLSEPCPEQLMSNLLFCGKDSMASKLAGEDFGKNRTAGVDLLPADYSSAVALGQKFSLDFMEPVYDFISSYLNGEKMIYERLLLPVRTMRGSTFLICYSMPISLPEPLVFGSSDEFQSAASRQNRYHSSHHQAARFQTPAVSRRSL